MLFLLRERLSDLICFSHVQEGKSFWASLSMDLSAMLVHDIEQLWIVNPFLNRIGE
jgi:hypothetical protein